MRFAKRAKSAAITLTLPLRPVAHSTRNVGPSVTGDEEAVRHLAHLRNQAHVSMRASLLASVLEYAMGVIWSGSWSRLLVLLLGLGLATVLCGVLWWGLRRFD
jgi:hypothetical protein